MIKTPQVTKIASFSGHRDSIYALAGTQSPFFYTAGSDGLIVRWDSQNPHDGVLIARVPNTVYTMQYDTHRKWLIVGQNFDGVHFISPESGKEIGSIHLENAPFFDILSFDDWVVVASGSGSLFVIDLKIGKVSTQLKLSEQSLRCLAYNPIQKHLAVGSSDGKIRLIETSNFSLLSQTEAHTNSVFSLAYSPDFSSLWSGSRDAHLKCWHITDGLQLHQDIIAHLYTINHIVFSPTGEHFATCSKDKSIKLWEASSGRLLKVIDKSRHAGHGTSVNKIIWISHKRVISCSDDRSALLWEISW